MLDALLDQLQRTHDGDPWYGSPRMPFLRGLPASDAALRPPGCAHSIWELVLHIAYWKYTVRRHLAEGTPSRFPRSPANFPRLPRPADEGAWAADTALLRSEHEWLVEAVRGLPARRLGVVPPAGKRWTYGEMVLGIAAHDAYHTGQIQLLKRLWQERALLGPSAARG